MRAGLAVVVVLLALLCGSAAAGVGSVIEQQDYGAVYSPDGARLAFRRLVTAFYSGTPAPHAFVMPASGGPARDLGSMGALVPGEDSLSWTPDGRAVVYQSDGIAIAAADGSSVSTVVSGNAFIDTSTAPVSPDGWLTFESDARSGTATLELVRVDGSDRHVVLASDDPRLPASPARFWSPTFSPDGGRIAFVYGDGVWTLDRTGARLTELDSGTQPAGYGSILSWSPDGRRLAYLGGSGVHLVDDRGARLLVPEDLGVGFGSISWSADGTRLVVPTADGYRLVDLDGTTLADLVRPYTPFSASSRYSSWSPDGTTIALNVSIPGCRTTSLALAPASLASSHTVTAECHISGTRHADHLVGNELTNIIHGFAGDDVIDGGQGHDLIYGGAGNDSLDSGPSGGTLVGGPGRDRLVAHGGDDLILARDGYRDIVDCGAGYDRAVVDRFDVVKHCERVSR